jgi:hypothetical protein
MSNTGTLHERPSLHRTRVSTATLFLGLALGPAAWALQLMLGYGLSSQACFPSDMPIAVPAGWRHEWLIIAGTGLAFLLIALGGVGLALHAWSATRDEKEGTHHALLEVGEGRARFLALCGVLAGSLFCLAILFDLAVTFSLHSCGILGS